MKIMIPRLTTVRPIITRWAFIRSSLRAAQIRGSGGRVYAALRLQHIVIRKSPLEFAPYLWSIFLHTASVEGDWQAHGYESSFHVSGKHDISSSRNQRDVLTGQPFLVEPLKSVGICDRA